VIAADRTDLLTLATDTAAGMVLIDEGDNHQLAGLLHGLLQLYDAAIRETCTPMGRLAIGVALEEIADRDPDPDQREAANLILASSAFIEDADALGVPDESFGVFGALAFNDTLARIDDTNRASEAVLAIATVWRRLAPWLHTEAGLEILRRVTW
jgi:hypothetical protein